MSEVYGRSLGGSSSETTARGETPKFSLARRDEREAAAREEPPHRDRSIAISLHEANSWREVSSPAILHPPYLCSYGVVVHPRVARGPLSRGGALPAPWTLVLTSTCCAAGEQPGSAACCSRFNREDGHQRPGASAPCCRRSTPARPAASSRWSWSPPPPPPSSSWIAHVVLGVCQPGPTSPPPPALLPPPALEAAWPGT